MLSSMGMSQPSSPDINSIQDTAMNVVYNVCSIVCLPVEMVIRPWYGSEFVSPVTTFFTSLMMVFLPFFLGMVNAFAGMLPFAKFAPPSGMFGIGTLSQLYFLGSLAHGLRVWRRMLHMEMEENSFFAGPPLPIFKLIPCSWWTTRIIVEPVTVFVLSIVLQNLFILQASAANYLAFAAVMLSMKNYVAWFAQWQVIRHLMNARNIGPIISKLVDNTASEDELARAHLATFPKNIPDDIRKSAVGYVAHAFSPKS